MMQNEKKWVYTVDQFTMGDVGDGFPCTTYKVFANEDDAIAYCKPLTQGWVQLNRTVWRCVPDPNHYMGVHKREVL